MVYTKTASQYIEEHPSAIKSNPLCYYRPITFRSDHEGVDRFELFILDPDEKKVETKEETRAPHTTVFTFNKEDHTLGNLLSQRLHKYPYVTFSAYKIPHPLFARFELRVSTDGTVTPKEAVIACCRDIVGDLEQVSRSFTTEWLGKRIVSEGEQERMARERGPFP